MGRNYAGLFEQLSRGRGDGDAVCFLMQSDAGGFERHGIFKTLQATKDASLNIVMHFVHACMQGDTSALLLHDAASPDSHGNPGAAWPVDRDMATLGQSVIADLREKFAEVGPAGREEAAADEPGEDEGEEPPAPQDSRRCDPLAALGLRPQQDSHRAQALPSHRKHRGYQPTPAPRQGGKRRYQTPLQAQSAAKSGGFGGAAAASGGRPAKRFAIREQPSRGDQPPSATPASLPSFLQRAGGAGRTRRAPEEAVSDTEPAAEEGGQRHLPPVTPRETGRACQAETPVGGGPGLGGLAQVDQADGAARMPAEPLPPGAAGHCVSPVGISAQRRFLASALQETPVQPQQACCNAPSLHFCMSRQRFSIMCVYDGLSCNALHDVCQGQHPRRFHSPKGAATGTLAAQLERVVQHERNLLGVARSGDSLQVLGSCLAGYRHPSIYGDVPPHAVFVYLFQPPEMRIKGRGLHARRWRCWRGSQRPI